MQTEDMILVSVDDHVIEPPDMFDQHIPAQYRDRAPRIITEADSSQSWVFEDQVSVSIGLNAVAGTLPEEYGINPCNFEQMRRGCFDINERVRDMSANGVLSSLNFPSFPKFCGQMFTKVQDKDLSLAVVRAYNDWHIDEWAGAHPGRIIPLAIMPFWDADAMAREVKRVTAKGCNAVTWSENPAKLGLPSFHSDFWDPFWQACIDVGTVVCLHIGSSSMMPVTASDAPVDVPIVVAPVNSYLAISDLLFSPVFKKFPDLTVALSEGGIGWIPYFLERADYVFEHHRAWTGADFGGQRPSDVFRDHVVTCFIDDKVGLRLRDILGVDSMTWECDYPHSDSTWPHSPERLSESLVGLSDAEINKITHENALRTFRFSPFSFLRKEESTVGALRAAAADVDVRNHSMGRPKIEGGTLATSLSALSARGRLAGHDG
jgi:predicted TIM-barrel fold metal-dependent hydrolase